MRAWGLASLLLLAACAREPELSRTAPDLDCSHSYTALVRAIAAAPDVRPAPPAPGEPYQVYNAEDGRTSYVVTQPNAPAHPAIVRQAVVRSATGVKMETTGCAYGDEAAYEELVAYVEGLGDR